MRSCAKVLIKFIGKQAGHSGDKCASISKLSKIGPAILLLSIYVCIYTCTWKKSNHIEWNNGSAIGSEPF